MSFTWLLENYSQTFSNQRLCCETWRIWNLVPFRSHRFRSRFYCYLHFPNVLKNLKALSFTHSCISFTRLLKSHFLTFFIKVIKGCALRNTNNFYCLQKATTHVLWVIFTVFRIFLMFCSTEKLSLWVLIWQALQVVNFPESVICHPIKNSSI